MYSETYRKGEGTVAKERVTSPKVGRERAAKPGSAGGRNDEEGDSEEKREAADGGVGEGEGLARRRSSFMSDNTCKGGQKGR